MRRHPTTLLSTSALVLALSSVTSNASAGERSAVSSLPVLPATPKAADPATKLGVRGLSVERAHGQSLKLKAAKGRGYCLVSRERALRLDVDMYDTQESELWRLTEDADGATLERTRFEVLRDEADVRLAGRTSVALRAVARADGVTVWGFRESNGDVTLVARGAYTGREVEGLWKEDEEPIGFATSECAFGAVRIAGKLAKTGAIAHLFGSGRPVGEGKQAVKPRFAVDASVSKMSRDPEPILSVRIRVLEG